ncbi:hypothetical protein H7F15_01685 [Pontibacter sp. Tf4]|uniref:hypothetical protein n=1 Tax=Pontibacter sp. Tf4 TaxID=2761620 RepID=UPI001628665F|nr:hypothetical protein [Pontibacter sp. Tf4]MBB6609736.1 hypothetical protein [Pontibacter sp. Tf4]
MLIQVVTKVHLTFIYLLVVGVFQRSEPPVVGKWMYEGNAKDKTQTEVIECPDVFEFRGDGTYTVSNDCYGDAIKPIVETGNWQINASAQKLILSERRFITNYHIYSPTKTIALSILSVDRKKLVMQFAHEKAEVYSRTK